MWTEADWHKGLCAYDQIGLVSAPAVSRTIDFAQFASPADAVDQAFKRLGGEAFLAWAEENPRAFFDMAAKHGFSMLVKQPPKELPPTPDMLTDKLMASLSVGELTGVLLRSYGITTKSQLLAAIVDSKEVIAILDAAGLKDRVRAM